MLSLERQRISSFEKSNLRRLAEREKLTLQTVLQSSAKKNVDAFSGKFGDRRLVGRSDSGWQQSESSGTAELQINLLFTVHSPSLIDIIIMEQL